LKVLATRSILPLQAAFHRLVTPLAAADEAFDGLPLASPVMARQARGTARVALDKEFAIEAPIVDVMAGSALHLVVKERVLSDCPAETTVGCAGKEQGEGRD
jgi:hypothetical protein